MTHLSLTGRAFLSLAAASVGLAMATSALAYQQAPNLEAKVAAGALPPVDERLPSNPRVIAPISETGQYGGTWRRAFRGRSDDRGPQKVLEARVMRFVQKDESGFELVPAWVSDVTVNEDSTSFTFTIRDGLRWSDGEPVTTEDVAFYFEVVASDIGDDDGNYPDTLVAGGERARLTIADDLTFSVDFAVPAPLFLQRLARDYTWMAFPKHYMAQFTPMYASEDDLAQAAEDFGVATYQDLWGRRGAMQSFWLNPDLPTLSAWTITTPPDGEVATFTRNPYYYAVDTEGNQLPYIDEIRHDLFQDAETLNLWIAQGRIDLQSRHVQIGDYPFLVENEANGDYKVVLWRSLNVGNLWPNQTTADPVLAKLFSTPDFRQALNLAVDRETINEVAYAGFGTPMQAGPAPGSQIVSEALLTKWIDYDPEHAEALLDEMGLAERDGDGYRLRPDGKPLAVTITVNIAEDLRPLELVADDWERIGIRTTLEPIERTLYLERMNNNDVEVTAWDIDRAANFLIQPGAYEATLTDRPWAQAYGFWRSDPTNPLAIEPPADHMLHKVWALLDEAAVATSEEKAFALGKQVLDLHAEAPNWVGLVGGAPAVFIVSDRVGNFPENFIMDDLTRDIGIIPTEQLFLRQ